MANDAPAESLSRKVEMYFSLLILFINGQNTLFPLKRNSGALRRGFLAPPSFVIFS